jgi:hypothetical protein
VISAALLLAVQLGVLRTAVIRLDSILWRVVFLAMIMLRLVSGSGSELGSVWRSMLTCDLFGIAGVRQFGQHRGFRNA